MQRFRTALLAAIAIGAGIPSIASAQMGDRDRGDQRGGDRPDRGQGGQRPDGGQFRQYGGQGDRQQPQMQQPPQQQAQQGRSDPRAFDRGDRQQFGQPGQRPDQERRGFGDGRGFADGRDDRRQGFDPRQGDPRRQSYDQRRGDPREGYAGNPYRGGDQRLAYDRGRDDRGAGFRGANGPQGRFGADWRSDRRYDWQNYRNGHRDVFRAGRYQPPRGYYNRGYRPFEVGFRLDPFFYASNYWIDDPYDYRLPPVWGSYRWVRYYDDVLLVDLASGEVADVIHQFFW